MNSTRVAGNCYRELRVHFIGDHHHVREQLIEVYLVSIRIQGIEDAHLQTARLLDQHGSGIALLQAQQSMRGGRFRCSYAGSWSNGITQTMNEFLEKGGQVGGSLLFGERRAFEQIFHAQALIPIVDRLLRLIFQNQGDSVCHQRSYVLYQCVVDGGSPFSLHLITEPDALAVSSTKRIHQ